MGEFEDTVQRARDGDETALDELEANFSGGTLRTEAEKVPGLEKRLEAAQPFMREARFTELVGKLDDDLKESGLTAADFADVDPDSLSLEMVRDKAKAVTEASQTQNQAAAEAAGIENVEDYKTALTTVKEQQTKKVTDMEAVTGGVASGGGDAGSGGEATRFDKSKTAFEKAKEDGLADDVAMASFIDVNLAEQSEPDQS